jgi:hypothetical protein
MQFYQAFPDEKVAHNFAMQRGYFQYLDQYCGLSFDRGNITALTARNAEGIFHWGDNTLSIHESKENRSLEESKLQMVSYLFEFVSGLCIGDDSGAFPITQKHKFCVFGFWVFRLSSVALLKIFDRHKHSNLIFSQKCIFAYFLDDVFSKYSWQKYFLAEKLIFRKNSIDLGHFITFWILIFGQNVQFRFWIFFNLFNSNR